MKDSIVDKIISYESGCLDIKETVELFVELLNTGLIRNLQGHYHRSAAFLRQQGLITYEVNTKKYESNF